MKAALLMIVTCIGLSGCIVLPFPGHGCHGFRGDMDHFDRRR